MLNLFKEKVVLFGTFFCVYFSSVFSQNQEIRFSHITDKQGLSQAHVNCILQDNKGFMWFGTQDGLNKYDGYSMTVYKYNPTDPNSLVNNSINCLYQDREGLLWIGTGEGLSIFNLATNRFINIKTILANEKGSGYYDNVTAVTEDEEGIIWISTDNGLNSFSKKEKKFFYHQLKKEKSKVAISFLHIDKQGMLWMASKEEGLYSFDRKTTKDHQSKFNPYPPYRENSSDPR